MLDADGQIDKLRVRIAKAMADVRKMEKRAAGYSPQPTAAGAIPPAKRSTSRSRKDASDGDDARASKLEVFIEACQRAGGVALARESGKELREGHAEAGGLVSARARTARGSTTAADALARRQRSGPQPGARVARGKRPSRWRSRP
jgi:hypothetical protein